MHQRQRIREYVVTLLNGITGVGANVYASRITPFRANVRPAIAVYTNSESVDDASDKTAPRELTRRVVLSIECVADAIDDVADVLDTIAQEVERRIANDDILGGAVSDCILSRTNIEFFAEGNSEIAIMQMQFNALYYQRAPEDSETPALDDFETFATNYDLGGEQATADEAKDLVEIP